MTSMNKRINHLAQRRNLLRTIYRKELWKEKEKEKEEMNEEGKIKVLKERKIDQIWEELWGLE